MDSGLPFKYSRSTLLKTDRIRGTGVGQEKAKRGGRTVSSASIKRCGVKCGACTELKRLWLRHRAALPVRVCPLIKENWCFVGSFIIHWRVLRSSHLNKESDILPIYKVDTKWNCLASFHLVRAQPVLDSLWSRARPADVRVDTIQPHRAPAGQACFLLIFTCSAIYGPDGVDLSCTSQSHQPVTEQQ